MFKAVIFDLDGVLIDSEIYWAEVEEKIWRQLGITDIKQAQHDVLGLNLDDTVKLLRQKYRCALSADEIKAPFHEYARYVYGTCQLMPGALALLQRIKTGSIPLAIASSSPNSWIDMFLARFKLEKMFDFVFSTESMNLPGKPDPAIYLAIRKQLAVLPEATVIFEDSQNGFLAAKRSGARVIAVPDPRWSYGDFSAADLVADSLADQRILQFIGLL
ncbi:MAG: HAD family phosphatase [Candidatus Magasanikbacteria bacterium]|nr:HAD family phosphatase [Candidatus Magasanikbacteria bacterium]